MGSGVDHLSFEFRTQGRIKTEPQFSELTEERPTKLPVKEALDDPLNLKMSGLNLPQDRFAGPLCTSSIRHTFRPLTYFSKGETD